MFGDDHAFEFGKAEIVREGSDVTLISTGAQTARTLQAADLLAAEGVEAHVLHVATLKPLDVEAIVAAAERTGRVITVEEGTVIGGLGGAVAEALAEHRPTRVHRIGLRDVFVQSGPNDALLDIYGLSGARVATRSSRSCAALSRRPGAMGRQRAGPAPATRWRGAPDAASK